MSIALFRHKRKIEAEAVEAVEVMVKSKKDEACTLFNQGKTPDDPELLDLGLKLETIKRYFRLWKKGL